MRQRHVQKPCVWFLAYRTHCAFQSNTVSSDDWVVRSVRRDAMLDVSLTSVCLLAWGARACRRTTIHRRSGSWFRRSRKRATLVDRDRGPISPRAVRLPDLCAFAMRANQHAGCCGRTFPGSPLRSDCRTGRRSIRSCFCAITPTWVVIPGTEARPSCQDCFLHFKGLRSARRSVGRSD